MTQLKLDAADRIIDAALSARRKAGAKPICIVVLDGSGHVVALKREDGASMFRPEIALGKAWGCVAMGEGGRALARRARENPAFFAGLSATSNGRLLPQPGGVLIKNADGAVLGAVGISGDTGANDEAFAVTGIEAAGMAPDTGEEA
jgi:uncharacterized protein GlcG (DUF336 family)